MMSEEYSTFARIFQKDAWSILMQIKVSSRGQSESDVSNFSIADSSESDGEDSKSSDSTILDDKWTLLPQ